MGGRFFGGPTMLTAMTEDDWAIVLHVFRAVRSRRGDKRRSALARPPAAPLRLRTAERVMGVPDDTVECVVVVHTDIELSNLRPGYDESARQELVAHIQA